MSLPLALKTTLLQQTCLSSKTLLDIAQRRGDGVGPEQPTRSANFRLLRCLLLVRYNRQLIRGIFAQ